MRDTVFRVKWSNKWIGIWKLSILKIVRKSKEKINIRIEQYCTTCIKTLSEVKVYHPLTNYKTFVTSYFNWLEKQNRFDPIEFTSWVTSDYLFNARQIVYYHAGDRTRTSRDTPVCSSSCYQLSYVSTWHQKDRKLVGKRKKIAS
jgi:hypothetical protein